MLQTGEIGYIHGENVKHNVIRPEWCGLSQKSSNH